MPTLESDPLPPMDTETGGTAEPTADPPRRRGRPPGSISKVKTEELTEKLTDQLISITVPLGIVSPLAYDYLCDQAESTAKALVRIAVKNPKARKALERFATGSDYAEIIKLPVGVTIGCLIDLQRVRPDTLIGKPFGMENRIQKLYGDDGSENPVQNGNGVYAPTGLRGMGADLP